MNRPKKRQPQQRHSNKKRYWPALLKILFTVCVILLVILFWLDRFLLEKLSKHQWHSPAHVYARPLELYKGLNISQEAIIKELQAAAYVEDHSARPGTFSSNNNQLHIVLRAFDFWDTQQETASVLVTIANQRISHLSSSIDNQLSIRLEPISIGKIYTGILEDRILVSLDEVPSSLIQALIATEDRDFYQHFGISPKAIMRATLANIRHRRIVQGGSTLTQQLVKNFFLSDVRSFSRKIVEAPLAVLLELHASKEQILEAYINEVYVAQDGSRSIHGFGLASQYLFNKPISSLTLAESALLVGMMKGPSYYNPLRQPERARARRNLVLDLMQQQGAITASQAKQAQNQALGVSQQTLAGASYPAYLDIVRRQLLRDYSEQQLANEGLRIFTNMDPQWQWHSQAVLQHGIARLQKAYPQMPELEGGTIVVDHATGDILALIAGKNPRIAGFNHALDAKRPIGSLVKPAIYLSGLEQGYTLASPLQDAPISIKTATETWQPQNFERRFHGETTLIHALAQSYNAATVYLGMQLGLEATITTLHRLGIEQTLPAYPSLWLGSVSLNTLEVAQMYSTIAANGFYTPLKAIRNITDKNGQPLKRYPLKIEQRITPQAHYLLDFALQTVMHQGTGKSVQARFANNTAIAGKTGTSNDQRDSWFAGYDRNRLAVVWLGNDDNLKLPLTGATGALPIWADIMQHNKSAQGARPLPENIDFFWIDENSGKLSAENCKNAVSLPFINGTQPQEKARCTRLSNPLKFWFKKWFSHSATAH